jgi:hypothetical protein
MQNSPKDHKLTREAAAKQGNFPVVRDAKGSILHSNWGLWRFSNDKRYSRFEWLNKFLNRILNECD